MSVGRGKPLQVPPGRGVKVSLRYHRGSAVSTEKRLSGRRDVPELGRGRPFYRPGPKARAEYRAFARRGGPAVLEVEPLVLDPPPRPAAPGPSPLEAELIGRGITPAVAGERFRCHGEEVIRGPDRAPRRDWPRRNRARSPLRRPGWSRPSGTAMPFPRASCRRPSGGGARSPGRPGSERRPRTAAASGNPRSASRRSGRKWMPISSD
jgi:hypothetical protein